MYSIEEAKLLCQRNRHYCSDSLIKKFKRLVRVDCAELYFTPLIALPDISDEVSCQDRVAEFVDFMDTKVWPNYHEFHTNTMLKTRRLSRSVQRQISTK